MLTAQLVVLATGIAVFASAIVARRRDRAATTFHGRCALACILFAASTTIGALS